MVRFVFEGNNPALECGIEPNDGLLVAYLPKLTNDFVQYPAREGHVVFVQDGCAIDILPAGKWWIVREAARFHEINVVEPIWHGPAGDFRTDRLPEVPRPHGRLLHMRAYSRGPWICLEESGDEDDQERDQSDAGQDFGSRNQPVFEVPPS